MLGALLIASPSAPAAVPSPATVHNRVVSLSSAGALGELTFRTVYTDTTATATATPGALRLPLGSLYRIRTCVLSKTPGRAPASVCESTETRPNAVTVVTGVTALEARMTVERPAGGGPAGTVAGQVLVDVHLPDNTYAPHATSWPSGGLPAAGAVVPPVGALGGLLLGPQGVAIGGVPGGGINSGTQDSICREAPVAPITPSAGSIDALGSLPFAYEVAEPPPIADLAALASQATSTGAIGPATVVNWATAAFGADRLAAVSAAGSRVRARVLYALAETDPLVPIAQASSFAAAQRRRDPTAYVDTLRLPAGDVLFEHGFVSSAGLQEFYDREQQLVAPLTIGDVIAPARARVRVVRERGLRVRFTCASRCSVAGRLELTAPTARRLRVSRVVGRGAARRSSRGRGTLTVRLSAAARRRIANTAARLISTVTANGEPRRQTARVTSIRGLARGWRRSSVAYRPLAARP